MKLTFVKHILLIASLQCSSGLLAQNGDEGIDSTKLSKVTDTLIIDGRMSYIQNNLHTDSIFSIYTSLAKDTSKWECYECERRKEFLYQESKINDSTKEVIFINGEIRTVLQIDNKGNVLLISNKVRDMPYHNSLKMNQDENSVEITKNDLSLELTDYVKDSAPFEILKTDTINNGSFTINTIQTTLIKVESEISKMSSEKIILLLRQSDLNGEKNND